MSGFLTVFSYYNPRVMEMQIGVAASHGVNTFIYDCYWYDRRPFLENCLNDGFLGAAKGGFKLAARFRVGLGIRDGAERRAVRNRSVGFGL
ncbi:MAG: hypothetical protein LBL66_01030 [Clostridiales bacterium]|jgi:hypothetical protein|nr:hypothetical protein [Clostridiales bacterium]